MLKLVSLFLRRQSVASQLLYTSIKARRTGLG